MRRKRVLGWRIAAERKGESERRKERRFRGEPGGMVLVICGIRDLFWSHITCYLLEK